MRAKTLCVAVLWWAGCSNQLSGDLEINGERVKLTSCRNGIVYGFRGVELTADSGMRVRIAATQTGEAEVVVAPAGSDKGTRLGLCGSFAVADQHSEINRVKNVEGKADLGCQAAGFTLKGGASFSNCH